MLPRNLYKRIDKVSGVMRHFQVSQQIKEAIRLGYHKEGEKLPTERKLEELFVVSRTTIRRALEELDREGIITKEWGSGIYIKKAPDSGAEAVSCVGLTVWQGGDLAYHPATLEILRGINKILEVNPCRLVMIPITANTIEERNYEETLGMHNLDGLILTVQEIPDSHINEIKKLAPRLVLSRAFEGELSVAFDFFKAGYEVSNYLISLGHRRIACLGDIYAGKFSGDAYEGYRKALEEHGIEFSEELVKYGVLTVDSGIQMGLEVMQLEEPPTAIIAGDGFVALGIKKALNKLHVNCPDDVSLASFTDFPFAEHIEPPLTTVNVPFEKLGEELMLSLFDAMAHKSPLSKVIREMRLEVRESTGPRQGSRKLVSKAKGVGRNQDY